MAGGGAGGREVGRISIRVVPNTDRFREELKAQLEAIERELKGQVKFTADFDSDGLKGKVKEAAEAAKAKVKVEADTTGVREKIQAAARDTHAKVKVDADLDTFQKRMLGELSALEKNTESKIKLDVDGERFRRALESEVKALSKSVKADIPIDLHLAAGQREKVAGEIEALKRLASGATGNRLRLHPEEDFRLRNAVSRIKPPTPPIDPPDFFGRFFGSFKPGGGGAGGGMGSAMGMLMDQTVLIVTAVAALLAPALALLATSLMALPALISAVALPLGALALGKDGIKKALENVGLLGEDKKGKSKAGEQLKELQKGISDEFEKGLTPVFKQLIGLLPTLSEGFKGIAKGIVSIAEGFTDAVTSPQGVEAIRGIFRNVGSMLTELKPGVEAFSSSLLNLTNVGSAHLPGLAHFIDDLGTRFNNWVSEMSTPGADGGPSVMDQAISNLRPAMDSVMNFVGQLTDAGLKMMANPDMAAAITRTFDSLTRITMDVLPGLEKGFEGLSNMLSSLANGLEKLNNWGNNGGGWLKDLLNKVGSILGVDGGNTASGSGSKGSGHAPVRIPGSNANFGEWWPDWHPKAKPGKGDPKGSPDDFDHSNVNNGLNWMDRHVGDPLKKFFSGDAIGIDHPLGAVGDALGKLFSSGSNSWAKGGGVIPQANADTTPFNPGPRAPQAPAQPVPGMGEAAGGANQAAQQAQAAAGAVKSAFDSIPGALNGIWGAVAAGAKGAFDGLVNAAKAAVQSIIAEIQRLPGEITQALSGLRAAGESAGQALGQGLASGIAAGKGAAVAAAQDLASAVEAAAKTHLEIHSPSKVFHDIGVNTSQGMANGLEEGAGSAIDRAKALAKSIEDAMNGGNGLAGVNGKAVRQQVSDLTKELQIQQDQLRVQEDSMPKGDKAGRQGIKDQISQIQAVRNQLKLDSDKLGFNLPKDGKGGAASGDSMTEAAQYITQALAKMIDSAKGFAMANVHQFEGDVGIGGKGAIPVIAETGIGWLQQQLVKGVNGAFGLNDKQGGDTHIHVNSVDDAIATKRNEDNKKALQYTRR